MKTVSTFVSNLAGLLGAFGLLAVLSPSAVVGSNRVLIDSGWRFQLGDPVDVLTNSALTNVAYYPEIPDLAKLDSTEVAGANSETYMETLRADPVATHMGENVSVVQTGFNDIAWRALNLPHDWAVELPFDSNADQGHGFKPLGSSNYATNNVGWYRRTFTLPASDAGQALWLEFDGVYRNCLVWLNGHILGRNVSGYSSFSFDITPYAIPGGTNVLVVRVDASRFEGWFYEGAGIYRHVWLVSASPLHVAHWGTYVATTNLIGSNATLTVQTTVTNQGAQGVVGSLTSTILDASSNSAAVSTAALSLAAGQSQVVTQVFSLANAKLWSLQTPYLYNLVSTVSNQTAVADVYQTPFGVRMVSFDPNLGFFLNGQHVEIQGMCNHQDHAGVGSAMPDRLQYFRVERLKQMGVDACRTSHNLPTSAFLEACDQLGMLVLDENRRVGTNAEPMGELQRQILRDRNHPCVLAWSLGNEEPLQGDPTGAAILQPMESLVHQLDPTRKCTVAMSGGWGSGFSTVIDVQGFNYSLGGMDGFHSSYLAQSCVGTEVASTVTTRGIYTNDVTVNGYVASYDYITTTASGLLQNPVTWGETAEQWWPFYDARAWASGGFVWTGFDYRGEPTPFSWPCISSHFGIMDTCGFPKDLFYYYQANWTCKPVLHLFPHWNWAGKEGQPISVWVYGNCNEVELFLNGTSQGRQSLSVQSHVAWSVPYTAGTLQAIGYMNGLAVATNTITTTGAPASIELLPDRSTILADGLDLSVVTVAVLDAAGRVVPTATNTVSFSISGGTILGVGDGNPSSHEADKASQRGVFNGLAEVVIQSTNQPGSIILTAISSGLPSTNVTITEAAVLPAPPAPGGVAAVASNAQVAISWDVLPGAATYSLWRATVSGGPYTLVAGGLGSLGYTDSAVTNFTTYYYVVTANGSGSSTNSAEVSATPTTIVSGLTASVINGQIVLNWSGLPGAAYNVKRSSVPGGPYAVLAASTASTNYIDASVVDCQTYYYVVTISNATTESLNSTEASATVPGALPTGFQNADVGSVGLAGSASFCGGEFTVTGSGADIWSTSDAFQFVYVYVPTSTNCSIRARVLSVQNTSGNAKAGLMIRETLVAGSRQALVDVEPSAGNEFIWRSSTGGSSSSSVISGVTAPYWVRLTRTNNSFQAYCSPDNIVWTEIGSATTISMATNAYVGLAVTAHNNEALNASVFDNLSISSLPVTTAPVLTPLGDQTVNVGQTVVVTASAMDTNLPSPKLTFSLVAGPADATLVQTNNTNAVFTWRPSVTDANTTQQIPLMVSDSYLVSSSATESFMVTVNPLVLPGLSFSGLSDGQLTLSGTNVVIGPDYGVLVSTNLANWSLLFITNLALANPFQWTDSTTTGRPMQFYRLKVGPPLP